MLAWAECYPGLGIVLVSLKFSAACRGPSPIPEARVRAGALDPGRSASKSTSRRGVRSGRGASRSDERSHPEAEADDEHEHLIGEEPRERTTRNSVVRTSSLKGRGLGDRCARWEDERAPEQPHSANGEDKGVSVRSGHRHTNRDER